MKAFCPACPDSADRKPVRFFIIGAEDAGPDEWAGEVWMHPSPVVREPLDVSGALPGQIAGYYEDAVRCYAHGLWRQAATSARLVLEGIVATYVPAEKDREFLSSRMKRLKDHIDLSRPVTDVADVLRDGGNLGAHFNEGLDPTPEMAGEMLDLLDVFVEYLFLLPLRTESLARKLEGDAASLTEVATEVDE